MAVIHEISIVSWRDLFCTRAAAECWLAVVLVLVGCSLAANAGAGSCQCGHVPGFSTMCCSGAEIFFLGIFLFFFVWSIVHSFIFYPVLYQRVVLDFQNDHTAKDIRGTVVALEELGHDEGPEYHLTIRYKRRGERYQIIYEDALKRRDEGDRIPLRVLRIHPRSAIPVEIIGQDFWPADSLRWSCPLTTFIVFGGLPALLFYINYPWPCFVFCLTFSLPATALLSRRRIRDVTNQVYNHAEPVLVEEFVVLAEEEDDDNFDDDDIKKKKDEDKEDDTVTVEPSLASCWTNDIELNRIT